MIWGGDPTESFEGFDTSESIDGVEVLLRADQAYATWRLVRATKRLPFYAG